MRRAEAMALGDEVSKSNEEYQALLGRLLGATPSAALEKQRSDVRLLADEFEAGRISEELYVEAILARLDLTSGKLDTAKDKGEEMQYVFTNAFKGMEDSLVSFVQTGKLDFSSLANSMIADMARVAIQQSITKPLVGAATSFLAGMFADGAAFDSGGVHAFANGGTFTNSIVSSPTPFMFANGGGFSQGIMGEAGDEAVMPLARGADGSLGVRASGGGGGSSMVVNVIESPGNGGQQNRRTENGVDVLDIMVEKIKSSIAGDISKGSGAVPAAMSRTYGLNRTVGAY
jgi:phage-related minor tail protein